LTAVVEVARSIALPSGINDKILRNLTHVKIAYASPPFHLP